MAVLHQYVDYATGTDDIAAGRGQVPGDPWKTIDHALTRFLVNDNIMLWVKQHTIATNVDTYGTGGVINTAVTGRIDRNAFKRIIGCKEFPTGADLAAGISDMDYSGAYYQSPLEAYVDGIDGTKTVYINAAGAGVAPARHIIGLSNDDNYIWRNFYIFGTDEAAGSEAVRFLFTPINPTFINCRFSNVYNVFDFNQWGGNEVDNLIVIDCLLFDMAGHCGLVKGNTTWRNTIIEAPNNKYTLKLLGGALYSHAVDGCLHVNGWGAGMPSGGTLDFKNNTVYNATQAGLVIDVNALASVHNNIFLLNSKTVPGLWISNTGSIIYNDYNCYYSKTGEKLDDPVKSDAAEGIILGSHSIEEDPLFVDAPNNNFRLKPNSPARRTGKPTFGAML